MIRKTLRNKLGLAISMAVTFIALLSPAAVLAVDVVGSACAGEAASSAICKDTVAQQASGQNPLLGPEGVITKGVKVFILIVGIITVVMFIISGIRLITSSGDSSTVNSARNGIIYAAIGIIIVLLAQIIVSFVLTKV